MLFILSIVITALACGSSSITTTRSTVSPETAEGSQEGLGARFLLGGWVVPKGDDAAAEPTAETLKAFVITDEDQLRNFLDGLHLIRVRGSIESLNRIDMAEVVVLSGYYLWRPLKGDPISILAVSRTGNDIEVCLELVEDPQGRESPYLMAPLYVAAIDKEGLSRDAPLRFTFLINGEVAASQVVTLQ